MRPRNFILTSIFFFLFQNLCFAQFVTIENYSVNNLGQAQLSIQGQQGKYYILHAQHNSEFNWATSLTIGLDGTMIISEPSQAYPLENYSITEHDIDNPDDYDGDGIDDITEFNNMPTDSPFNYAPAIDFIDGSTSIPDADTFMELATVNNVSWAPFLDDQLYVKFGILDRDTPNPKVYFINSNTYTIHASFWSGIGASVTGDDASGEIVFNPNTILPTGIIGTYSFNFSFGDAYNFEDTQRTYELLVASMPFLQNNMNHFIGQADENDHLNNYADEFVDSRFDVVLETDVFAEVNYIPFHLAEGYGYFRHMQNLNETPGSRDIVLYDALPNSLPRVGGIITSVIQTPLSHVNLRAIQDNVPNAYIADPLSINEIASLLNGYIYYKVENDSFEIREATLDEVNDWYENIRPSEPQFPIRDLSITEILPLADIDFEMSTAFGAKCANVSTMRTFQFPEGTIPDGFGIPFYYYDEFMQFNNFYEEVQIMIDNPSFQYDINFRVDRLQTLRTAIKDAPMPQWMLDDLQAMHDAFPDGTAVRVRSSTNNEDLPGFSGAGLYTSKTQYPDEGHISKSVKQVFASMWNFRAYEERDFYRIDHFSAAMGLLCHPNYQQEQSNGVGISIDPIYETEDTFYLNTQVGESLITNPDPNSVPEEILLYRDPTQSGGYLVLRLSNLVNAGELIMDDEYLNQMRDYLTVIHDEFAILYDVAGQEDFAMDIEYKVTAQNQLAIKQARPWVSFWADINGDYDLAVDAIINPETSSSLGDEELVTVTIANYGLNDMSNFDIQLVFADEIVETITITEIIEPFEESNFQFTVPIDLSNSGDYEITVNLSHPDDVYENNDSFTTTVSNILQYDGSLEIEALRVLCGDLVEVDLTISNLGETTINEIEIEIGVNGVSTLVNYESFEIEYSEQETITLVLDQNLQESNDILLDIISVNNQNDENTANDIVTTTTTLESSYDIVTFIINPDNYPQETSWKLYDSTTNEIVHTGSLNSDTDYYIEDICVNFDSCFTLDFFDSYGDGICCGYGEGNFMMIDLNGNVIFENDGIFDNFTQETFCLGENGCEITAEVNVTNTSSEDANDGLISIVVSSGVGPYQYSIDGGLNYSESNTFTDLSPGDYNISVIGSAGTCEFEQDVAIQFCSLTAVDVQATGVPSSISTDGSITITPNSGEGPYQYSIDGGQTFFDDNFFTGLPSGLYNIVVVDSQNICSFEDSVRVEIESVIINEINYRSSDEFSPNDWIELYNPKSYLIDLSDWQIRDDNNNHIFYIPESTQIEPEGFLVIVRDELDFSSSYPGIPHIGELGFGLGGSDAVRLFNSASKLIDEVDYDTDNSNPNCDHTLNMIDSYGDGWNGNAVSVVVNGQIVVEEATFQNGYFEDILFEATHGDTIQLIWYSGSWSEEVSFEILDGYGNIISSGHYGDTLEDENVLAFCSENVSDWDLCADGTGYTLELISPELDNSVAENWDCINEFGSPNAPNTSNLSIPSNVQLDNIRIYPNPVDDILQISGNRESYNIEIYSLTGQKLYTAFNISNVDMSPYANGIYIIKVYHGNSLTIKRIIKSN